MVLGRRLLVGRANACPRALFRIVEYVRVCECHLSTGLQQGASNLFPLNVMLASHFGGILLSRWHLYKR